MPLLLHFSCPVEETRNKLKGFIEDFYTYDFTGIIYEEASDDESDFEMDTIEIDDNVDLAGAVRENNQKESEGSLGNEEKDVDDESDFEIDTIEIDDNVDLAGVVGENNQKESEGSSGNEEKDVITLD